MGYFVEQIIEDVPDEETRIRTLNILKMNLYIFAQFHSCSHDKQGFESSTTVTEKVRVI